MRRLTIAALTALAALAAQSAAAKDFVVGLSWNAMDNQLPVKWQEYLQSEGKTQGEAAGVNFKWVINVADANPSRQASNIEDLINQNVNLIIARAEDASAIGASIRAAKAANIPFITFDRQSKTTKPAVHVGGDSYDQGKTTAEAFVALLKEKGVQGKCIELEGSLTDINALNRSKAWHEVTDKSGVVQTLESVPTDGTLISSVQARSTLSAPIRTPIACSSAATSRFRPFNPHWRALANGRSEATPTMSGSLHRTFFLRP